MSKKDYGKLEQHIISIFKKEGSFYFNGENYTVQNIAKPTVSSGGECKTDVFLEGKSDSGKHIILKLSVKRESNNEFQENKVSAERAESYFGSNWSEIIKKSCLSIMDNFHKQPLVFATGKHPTKPNSITLGWKLEIASKPRTLSTKIDLTDQEVRDYVYKGTNLSSSKKNALINGVAIPDSGVAEYILFSEIADIKTTADVINNMKLINSLIIKPTYLIFTGNNLRTAEDKTDGARPLAVKVKWQLIEGKISREIVFDAPLEETGKDRKHLVYKMLKELGISHPSKMSKNNFVNGDIFIP